MHAALAKRLHRDLGNVDDWRFAEIDNDKLYRRIHYTTYGIQRKRTLVKEGKVYNNPIFEFACVDENANTWKAFINYPDAPDKKVEMSICFPDLYPMVPPIIRLISNIPLDFDCMDKNGYLEVCKITEWTPVYTIGALILVCATILFPNWGQKNEQFRQTQRSKITEHELVAKVRQKQFCCQDFMADF